MSGKPNSHSSPHDHSYRLLFSEPDMVTDLLRGYVREPWVKGLDFSTLEPVKNDFITRQLHNRRNDCIWRVRWRGEDRWLYVFLVLEFQSRPDRHMAVRLMTYLGLLYQELIKTHQLTPSGKLPPALPLVLYNGKRRWRAVTDVAELIDHIPGGLEQYRPHLRYLLVDESRYRDDPLPQVRNLVSALFGLENSQQPEDVQRVLEALAHWLKHPEQASLHEAFMVWLKQVFLPARIPGVEFEQMQELQEVNSMLAERVKEWPKEWERKGLLKGRQEGEATVLRRQLTRRFGPLPQAIEQRLQQASIEELEHWADNILDASTLDEVFV